ncbi:B28 [miniopterid betaherpesvirus 1]|uniref:B28 n=1 Tax=miniopterid betaherpesvirus 1 TaxID=3070189 RepID=I3VPZ6_9BETA|nr:B28 [miniopterid betaherpesvirus 1]AFK83840.1 B28 [miniopterid betaherpesvirus 1]
MSVLDFINACPKRPDDGRGLDSLKTLVTENRGLRIELGWPHGEYLVVGPPEHHNVLFDVDGLKEYACVTPEFDLTVIGVVRLGGMTRKPVGGYIIICSSGGRVYAYSLSSRFLYIVSDCGFDDVVNSFRGLRNVYELYDVPCMSEKEERVQFGYNLSPIVAPLMSDSCDKTAVEDFLFAYPRFTYEACCDAEGYVMFGTEVQLNLLQFVPGRVFWCLKAAGYRVLGQGCRMSIILFNEKCEVFVLMRDSAVMKIANTVRAFLRDRLQFSVSVKKQAFAPVSDVTAVCVGDVLAFDCDVKYVLQCDDWFVLQLKRRREAYAARKGRRELEVFVL